MDNPVFTSLRYYTWLNNALQHLVEAKSYKITAHSQQFFKRSVIFCDSLWPWYSIVSVTQTHTNVALHWWIDQVGGRCGRGIKNGISKLRYHFAGHKSNLRHHFAGQSRERSLEVVRQAEDCFCDQYFISQIYPSLFIMETFYSLIKSRT